MKILITGATGMVGRALIKELFNQGHEDINVLSRSKESVTKKINHPVNAFEWNPETGKIDRNALKGVRVIVNLAGESVFGKRWTEVQKQKILNSRVLGTKLLVREAGKTNNKIKFISASAIGYYGEQNNSTAEKSTASGNDFLAEVCKQWEAAATQDKADNIDTYILRIGMVLSADGGALKQLLPIFKLALGGPIGTGQRYMSWIHISDLVNQFIYIIKNDVKHSVFNATSPEVVNNLEFTKTLGQTLHRLTLFPVPPVALKLLLGEMSSIVLTSQNIKPQNFINSDFKYKYENLSDALEDLLKYEVNAETVFQKHHWVSEPVENVFEFFSNENNLEKITPKSMHFKVLKKSTEKIEKNTLIVYKLKVHGIPMRWKTLIKEFDKNNKFVDSQLTGPYKKWEHTHSFSPCKGGTLISDKVVYKLPLGFLGRIAAGAFVKKDVQNIFNYRSKYIDNIFKNEKSR